MMTDNLGVHKKVLLIEDSDEDFMATARAIRKSGLAVHIERAANAREALDALLAAHKTVGGAPSLILLDLNLPGADGRELLTKIKADPLWREIPVVVLTTSRNPRDISFCYRQGANCYQTKQISFDNYFRSIKTMLDYWFRTAVIPANGQ